MSYTYGYRQKEQSETNDDDVDSNSILIKSFNELVHGNNEEILQKNEIETEREEKLKVFASN
jgi:hypothetical protein